MKNLSLIGSIIFLLLSLSQTLAHPADSIEISFDSSSTLTIKIHHPVKKFPSDHYINQVTVKLNDKEIIKQIFKTQTNREWQNVIYTVIDAKPGDKIIVTALCSLFGKMTETLVLSKPKVESEK
jgi:hypothetical protein|uniref:Desulfoferrodoxin ferrous iron-binding domain-containing protein n=1 Tax=candidate division WOR-3 bacterium TaxID=2052148 RepID=A0A7C6A7S8_UNCW3